MKESKQFLIIANMNAITYKEVFPLIMNNKLWLGPSISSGDRKFKGPDNYPLYAAGCGIDEGGKKYIRVKSVRWFTNLDHGRRHQPLPLMAMSDNLKYSKHKEIGGKAAYDKYDNYNAVEVPFTDAIPSDYRDIMGVPISFLDKFCPEQFEIVGMCENLDLYLPPYSPDLNPIELMWSKVKAYLRKRKARTLDVLNDAINEALKTVTQTDLKNWFAHNGYRTQIVN